MLDMRPCICWSEEKIGTHVREVACVGKRYIKTSLTLVYMEGETNNIKHKWLPLSLEVHILGQQGKGNSLSKHH